MPLSLAQLQAVKADIAANSDLSVHLSSTDGNQAVADLYNALALPVYWVWKTFVSDVDIYTVVSVDGTSWSWSVFIARSQGERDAWRQMVNMAGGINPSLANMRSGIADIFSGAGGAAQRTHLLALGRRTATRIEKLLAVATVGGSGTRGLTTNPDTLAFDSILSGNDVLNARNS